MKLEEVLPALRAGKRVRLDDGDVIVEFKSFYELSVNLSARTAAGDSWSIVEEPATDDELAAAFEAEAAWCERCGANGDAYEYAVNRLRQAADMVRKRYVDPSWKVGK